MMTHNELSTIILDNLDFVCYISDPATYDLLYFNKAGREIAGECTDGKCYEVLQGLDHPCPFCTNHLLKPGSVYQWEYHNEKFGKYFALRDTLVELDGRRVRLELAYDITASKERELELNAKLSLEETLVRCIHTLAEENDIQMALNGLLSIVGNFYEAERAYIFEFDYAAMIMNNTYEWCKPGVQCHITDLQGIPLFTIEEWIRRFKSDGAFYLNSLDDEVDPESLEYKILAAQNIQSLMVVPLEKKGELIGFLGVDNPFARTNDFRLLRSVPFFVLDDLSKRRMITKLEQMSFIDTLTGLGNRNKYTLLLENIETEPPQKTGVIYIDINGLKAANDQFGHNYGDHLIRTVADKIKCFFTENAFRVGGDEFIVLCRGMERNEFENKVAMLRGLMEREDEVRFSIGSSWSDGDIDVVRQIMRADELMYIDKQNYYKTSVQSCGHRCNSTKTLLQDIENGSFVVYLQPKVALSSGKIIGAEALVRRIMNGQVIPPIKFIPVYEAEGTISHLDFFVFEKVCATLAQWKKENISLPISVNLSRITLMENDVVGKMRKICANHGIDTHSVNIEVTESVGKMDITVLSALLSEFRTSGFRVSLDDFGSEYSNLAILTDMDFDEVKVDKSLIHDICSNHKSRVVVEYAVKICRSLGLANTVAEGIETSEQKQLLDQCHCKVGQGFLFSRPIPIDEFYSLYLKEQNR